MTETVFDTVVVGAGLSGLQTALDLSAAGKTVVILEAQFRVGGKVLTFERSHGRGAQELGAAWLNDTNQSHVWKYCKQFQLTPVVQNIVGSVACEDAEGRCHMFPFGELPKFSDTEVANIALLREKVESVSLDAETFKQPQRAEIDQLTFEQWCRQYTDCPQALRTATLWCRGTTGQDPSDVSALAFLEIARGGLGITNLRYDGKHGAQYLRLEEGTQDIPYGMAKLLPKGSLRLNCPVTAINKDGPSLYNITTHHGNIIQGRSVVVSVPSPACKDIFFSPPLSPMRRSYITATRYGVFIKYICFFKSPFWKSRGCCGLAQSFKGPINHCRDTSSPAQQNYALTCFITSTPGRIWSSSDDDERKKEAILRQLSRLFDVEYQYIISEFLANIESEWVTDKWAGYGCPFPATPPGVLGHRSEDWFTESSDGLFFVGTEYTVEWRGYMEGALRSGKRGAAQALTYLNS